MKRKIGSNLEQRIRLRQHNYLSLSDEMDAVLKGLEEVSKHIALPQETLDVIAHWRGIKEAFPKQGKGKSKPGGVKPT